MEIFVRMIKICDDAIIEPLSLSYKNCIENGTFPAIWKKSNIVPTHEKEINRFSTIVDLFHWYRYLVKYLKEFYLTHHLIIFKKTISFVNISLGFDQMIHAYINYFQLYMIFMLLLILVHHSMLEAYFWTCLKYLTKFSMRALITI